jgi:hypothetical protein
VPAPGRLRDDDHALAADAGRIEALTCLLGDAQPRLLACEFPSAEEDLIASSEECFAWVQHGLLARRSLLSSVDAYDVGQIGTPVSAYFEKSR